MLYKIDRSKLDDTVLAQLELLGRTDCTLVQGIYTERPLKHYCLAPWLPWVKIERDTVLPEGEVLTADFSNKLGFKTLGSLRHWQDGKSPGACCLPSGTTDTGTMATHFINLTPYDL